jgi:pimeloyl-ACP methyl ester carboxylesterase
VYDSWFLFLESMATFCLIHGSAQSPRGWDLLTPELQRRGHEVLLADLPAGVTQLPWQDYSSAILDACGSAKDVILVGASMSGIFLPLVATQSEGISKMVFEAGMIPVLGISPLEMVRSDRSMFNPAWIGKDPTRDPAIAREFLFHDCSPEVAEWAIGTMRLMVPMRVLNEPIPIQAWPAKQSVSIVCRDDRTILPDWSRRKAKEMLGVEPLELPGGHCPHVSRPAELAELLNAIA